jgi:MFS family permease
MGLIDFLKREFSFITGNYRILIISWIIMDLAMEMPVPNYQYYVQALGGAGLALGIIGFANFLAMAAVAFPGGYLADKCGRRWLVSTMTFGLALSYIFFALAPTWHYILIGTIIQSLCLSTYQPALFALVQDSLPPERRGVGSSLIQMIHGTFNTPGPIIGGLLLLRFTLVDSMRIVYSLVMILFLIAAMWRLKLKETMENAEPMRLRYIFSSYPSAVKESFGVWKTIPRSVLWLVSVQIIFMFSNALVTVINAVYARDVLGIPETIWWITFVPLLLTMMAASVPVGKMVDRFGCKIGLMLGPVTLAVGLLLFVHGNFYTIMISMILLGLVFLMIMSSAMALSAELVRPENRGKVRGFLNFMGYISTGVGMLLGNYFYNLYPPLPFYLAITLALPMTLMVLFRVHETKEQSKSSP